MTRNSHMSLSSRTGYFSRLRQLFGLAAAVGVVLAVLALSPAASLAQAASRTWFVAPAGSASSCASNSKSVPFGTVQAALACAGDGDVVSLAPSGSTPYPGIGAVSRSVTIKAGSGDARSVKIDLSQPQDAQGYTAGLMAVPSTASVKVQGVTLACSSTSFAGCLSQTCETTSCVGALITNHGTLALAGVVVSGAQHGAAINNVTAGSTPARLTLTSSAIVHNSNDGVAGDGSQAAGISSTSSGAGTPTATVKVVNSTIADNTASSFGQAPGGLYTNAVQNGAVTLINATISGNSGGNNAGGLSDIVGSGGAATPVLATNTLIAGNTTTNTNTTTAAPDCQGKVTDGPGGHNLIGNNNNCVGLTNGINGDQVGTPGSPINPQLGPVALNGGPTPTMAELAGSPAIATASSATCNTGPVFDKDQRGQSRNVTTRNACDIGAYDTGGATPTH
jgi:hypothetical protein